MKIVSEAFVLFLLYIHIIDGLVYAGYKAVTKQKGISLLDRYRCAETYVGFEYIGLVLSPDGVCTAVQYGWSGVVSPGSEYLKKTWNCNVFDTPIEFFKESDTNSSRYNAPIPGELVTGSSIELVFVPQEPWDTIFLKIRDESEIFGLRIVFLRDSDEILFRSLVSGNSEVNSYIHGVEIMSGSVAKLTVTVNANSFKVFVNDKEKYDYQAVLSLSHGVLRTLDFGPSLGSTCLIKSICFKNL